jgi:predicted transcriptional regulator
VPVVGTNEAVRQRALQLIDLGLTQKMLAQKMGVTETWFSRWVNQKTDPPLVITVEAKDRFERFIEEVRRAIEEPPPRGSNDSQPSSRRGPGDPSETRRSG